MTHGIIGLAAQQHQDIGVARELASLGMPMFLAWPDAAEPTGYKLPRRWQQTEADPAVVDRWEPGLALCAVTGHVLDLIDVDPRSGGVLNEATLSIPVLAQADTPSGGHHRFVLPIGVDSRDGVWPGVDVKSGTPDGTGRGFAFIAPTVRRSKVDGIHRAYTWSDNPVSGRIRDALNWVRTHGNGHAVPLRARIAELRTARAPDGLPRRLPQSVARAEWDRAYERLVLDLRHWAATGWGGEAHAGLLAHTTHLARLSPDNALEAYLAAFTSVGLTADDNDMTKVYSAIDSAVPDVVVPDADMPPQELFWAGAEVPLADPGGETPAGPRQAGPPTARAGYVFDPVTRERYRNRTQPPTPAIGSFGGEHGLFYAAGVHWLQGESESGKSWVALSVVAECLRSGERVLVVDYEDTEGSVLERLACCGVTDDEIENLTYVDGGEVLFTELCAHVATVGYGLVVVDGVTSSLSAARLSGRDEQELTAWADALPRRARMAVCVDHVVKAVDERRGMAVGSQAKKSVVTGSSYEVVCTRKFGRGSQDGEIRLNLQKDKPGGLRGRGVAVVRLRFLSDSATGAVTMAVPKSLRDATAAFLGTDDPAVRTRALYERLVAWEESGGAIPPKMGMRDMRRLLSEELNEHADHPVKDAAIRMFKRSKGLPVAPEPAQDDG